MHQHRRHLHPRLDKGQLPPIPAELIPSLSTTKDGKPATQILGRELEITSAQERLVKKDLERTERVR